MAADRQIILAWLSDLASAIVEDADDAADFALRVSQASALDAPAFAAEMIALMRIVGESVNDPADFDRLAAPVSSGETADAVAILLAIGLAIGAGRPDWPSRPRARAARTRVASAGDVATAAISKLGGDGAELYAWMTALIAVACRLVSDLAADAAPILKVSTGISQPSTVLAYHLYGDAARAAGLVDIAGSATPLVMPISFDALAS